MRARSISRGLGGRDVGPHHGHVFAVVHERAHRWADEDMDRRIHQRQRAGDEADRWRDRAAASMKSGGGNVVTPG